MDFLQGISKAFTDTSNNVKKKALEAAELAKLRGQLSDLNQELERLYGQVGKAYYTARGSQESFDSADAFCDRITALRGEIAELQHTIDSKRSRTRCKNCGAVLSPQAKFCIECGEKVSPEDIDTEEEPAAAETESAPETPQE